VKTARLKRGSARVRDKAESLGARLGDGNFLLRNFDDFDDFEDFDNLNHHRCCYEADAMSAPKTRPHLLKCLSESRI
jgi:hypothetical protein